MGYRKWRLGEGDQYQIDFARYRVARMLEAHAGDSDGPVALSCEAPVDGWDDIVEFAVHRGSITATHYQIKHQNTDFPASELTDTFAKLFANAAKILQQANPYGGLEVPASRRRFVVVLPTADISVGAKLGIDQLCALIPKFSSASAAATIVANDGAKIDDGKAKGDQQRTWLTLVKNSVGTNDVCARLLQQMAMEILPPGVTNEHAEQLLASHFEFPQRARLVIDAALRDSAPEGRLDVEELLTKISDAQPCGGIRRIRLARVGAACFVRPYTKRAEMADVAGSIVENVWRRHGALELHVGYGPPDDARTLRLACVRLLLHSCHSPVYVTERDAWWDRCRAEVAGVIGLAAGKDALDGERYMEKAAPVSLPPNATWAMQEFGNALHAAMDAHIWECVHVEGKTALIGAEGVPFAKFATSIQELEGAFDRVLRGWWSDEGKVSGVARAGPTAAPRIALIVAGVAVLQHLGFEVTAAADPGTIATLGGLPIRAIAIEQVGGSADGLPMAVALCEHARDILSHPGIVLLIGDSPDDLYDLAQMQSLNEPAAGGGILTSTLSAFLIDARSLVASVKHGDQEAKTLVRTWCRRRAQHHLNALDAAVQQWRESDAA